MILALSFILSYIISKKISSPIIKLSDSAKKLAKGKETTFVQDTDIEEINELGTTLNQAKEELIKTDTLRRDLLANVSHDLKTPLTMIRAYAELVRDLNYDKEEKRNENLNVIIEETERLTSLVNDILELSSIEATMGELKLESFNLIDVIHTVLNHFKIYNLDEGYQFVFRHPKTCYVVADQKKLTQVIYNLLINAINYTGNDKKVTIQVIDEANKTRVEIIDTGKGIKKEEIPVIWDKYYKNDKHHKRNVVGTGLGLSIVKQILESHNFEYGVSSKTNHGTTFYFEIKKKAL